MRDKAYFENIEENVQNIEIRVYDSPIVVPMKGKNVDIATVVKTAKSNSNVRVAQRNNATRLYVECPNIGTRVEINTSGIIHGAVRSDDSLRKQQMNAKVAMIAP